MERRQWVKAIGAVSLGALGGCVDEDDSTTPETEGDPADSPTAVSDTSQPAAEESTLPPPGTVEGEQSVATAIGNRRSRREYGPEPLTAAELGQLLWAAQGTTNRRVGRQDLRAAPSAGATYPLELFVVIGDPGVEGFEAGVYHYDRDDHALELVKGGAHQAELQAIAVDQAWVGAAALDIVLTGVDERTTERYGQRGRERYVPMEVGHVGQNIYLQAESLGLSTVAIGAFRDADLRALLEVSVAHRPLCLYPVGRRR
jgi:SagB-type dehydrogenase family enzyme